jgi:hypothetical protein
MEENNMSATNKIAAEELFMMLTQLENRLDNMEDLITTITRVLVAKGVYTVQEAFDEYGKLGREKAKEENKINLEAEIEVLT